jgi:hypothetical protein
MQVLNHFPGVIQRLKVNVRTNVAVSSKYVRIRHPELPQAIR